MATLFDFASLIGHKYLGELAATDNTEAVDTAGFDGVAFAFYFATGVSDVSIDFFESDDTTYGNATPVERYGSYTVDLGKEGTRVLNTVPKKRYVFAKVTGAASIVCAIKGYAHEVPVT